MNPIRFAPDVFFRLTPNKDVILYKTSLQKVFLLDGRIYKLLSCIRQSSEPDQILALINSGTPSITKEEFAQTVQQLTEIGILLPEVPLEERKRTLESSVKMSQYDSVNALFSVQFELTFRCNEHCRHCYCPRENDIKSELTTDEIKHIIDDLREMNVVDLTFTGGDLFMRKDTFEILEYAYSSGFTINIFTNCS